jgi:hypothetical protein
MLSSSRYRTSEPDSFDNLGSYQCRFITPTQRDALSFFFVRFVLFVVKFLPCCSASAGVIPKQLTNDRCDAVAA